MEIVDDPNPFLQKYFGDYQSFITEKTESVYLTVIITG